MTHHAASNPNVIHPSVKDRGSAHQLAQTKRRASSVEATNTVIGDPADFGGGGGGTGSTGTDPFPPGVILDDSGLLAQNSGGGTTMSIDTNGNVNIAGGTIIGSNIQTSAAFPSVDLSIAGLAAYNSAGVLEVFISATDGSFTASGTSTITGGTFQTAAPGVNPRLAFTPTGIVGYNGSGVQTISIGVDGTFTLSGNSTITGATIQTSSSNPRVVMDATGLHSFNSTGQEVFNLGSDGSLLLNEIEGSITITTSGVSISSAPTTSTGARIVMNALGITGYNAANVQEFYLDTASGLIEATGVLTSQPGSTVPWQTTGFFIGGGNLLENSSAEDPTSFQQFLYINTGAAANAVPNLIPPNAVLDSIGDVVGWTNTMGNNVLLINYTAPATMSEVTTPAPQYGTGAAKIVATGGAVSPPVLSGALAAGGTLTVGTPYGYTATAHNEFGETIASNVVTLTPTTGNQTATLSWPAVAGALNYTVYRSDGWRMYFGGATTFTDTGPSSGLIGEAPLTNNANNYNQGIGFELTGNFLASTPYTFSVYLQGNVGGEQAQLQFGAAADYATSAQETLTNGWVLYSVTWTPHSTRINPYVAIFTGESSTAAETFFANAAQVVQGSAPAPWTTTNGTFQLQYGTNTPSASLMAASTAAQVQTALQASGVLPATATVVCTGGPLPSNPITVALGNLGLTPTVLSPVNQTLVGGSAEIGAESVLSYINGSPDAWWGMNNGVVEWIPLPTAYHGANVLELANIDDGDPSAYQTVGPWGLIPGTTYTLSGYFKSPLAARAAAITLAFEDINGNVCDTTTAVSTWTMTGNWQRFMTSLNVPTIAGRQQITLVGSPTIGAFTLTYNGQVTGPIQWNATAAQLLAAVQALSNVGMTGAGYASGGPLPNNPVTITFLPPAGIPTLMTAQNNLGSPYTGALGIEQSQLSEFQFGTVIGEGALSETSILITGVQPVLVTATLGVQGSAPGEVFYLDAMQLEVGDAPTAYSPQADEIVANVIQANMINVGQLSAISANLGVITAGTITGAVFQTATSGARVIFDSNGIRAYNSVGTNTLNISGVDGSITASTGTISGATITGTTISASTISGGTINSATLNSPILNSIAITLQEDIDAGPPGIAHLGASIAWATALGGGGIVSFIGADYIEPLHEDPTYYHEIIMSCNGIYFIISDQAQATFDGAMYASSFTNSSVLELKRDIEPFTDALSTVRKMRGVSFHWKNDPFDGGKRQRGMVAEEVEQVLPIAVRRGANDGAHGAAGVDTYPIVATLVEAVKEIAGGIDTLNLRLDDFQYQLSAQKAGAQKNKLTKLLADIELESFERSVQLDTLTPEEDGGLVRAAIQQLERQAGEIRALLEEVPQ